jgi:putative ABC transport system permease protein
MPGDPEGAVPLAFSTDRAMCFVMMYPIGPEYAMPFDSPQDVIDGIHESMYEDQGLIEVDSGKTKAGNKYIESIVKTVKKEGGAAYTFTFHGLDTEEAHEEFEASYRAAINMRHHASPTDKGAIWINNHFTQNLQLNKARRVLNIALWIIGLFTLLGGIVGVSNIMLITVKERTHEFGIRKAIGASPLSITKLIMAESVTITAFFGYVGMIAGLAACELLDKTLGQQTMDVMGEQIAVLINPTVGIDVAVEATILLIIAGSIAGLAPALKAARVRPIEALRAE